MSGKVVLVNRSKIKSLIHSPLADTSTTTGRMFKKAQEKLASIAGAGGCNCKKGPKRNAVYDDVLTQLRGLNADKLSTIKDYLNATTLNLGKGYQV